jgi:hypothetical protein
MKELGVMTEGWSIDVKKYVPDADDGIIAAIVKHCGIALQSRDASLVSFSDPAERDVVRESWLKNSSDSLAEGRRVDICVKP